MRPGISWLDLKLSLRMLWRYPGLTVVGFLAMTVAIGVSAAWFEFTRDMFDPSLPLEEGDRVVAITNWDAEAAAPELRSLHEFTTWRAEVTTIEDIAASSSSQLAVATEDGRSTTVPGAQMTATGFRVAREAALIGRTLVEEDERPESPPVVVIGYDLWQRLFDGSHDVLGQVLELGGTPSTIVGVMPPGFGLPINHEIWRPFRENPLQYERREGPYIRVFGRLAAGASLEDAQRELSRLGEQAAVAFPESNRQLSPRVERYAEPFVGGNVLLRSAMNVPFLLLLIVICTNVATLVFARTATRRRELVTRSALGASRGRLVLQLFAEALVITSLAAASGLLLAAWGLDRGMNLFWQIQQSRPPFWFRNALSPSAVLYAGALALLGAALIGGIPALKATGRNLRSGLSHVGASSSRLRFGALSTGVIVVQVALCVVFLPIAMARGMAGLGDRVERVGFPADEYLSALLTVNVDATARTAMEGAANPALTRPARLVDEVKRRVASEPGVSAVTFASRLPGMNHPYEWVRLEDGLAVPDSAIIDAARALSVDVDFFEALDAPVVAGRGFQPSDIDSEVGVAIVDQAFVREILQGRNALGQRLRYPGRSEGESQRWYQIVGVVEDLAMNAYGPGGFQDLVQTGPAGYVGVYHPLRPGQHPAVQMFVRTATPEPEALIPRIQSTIAALDPSLVVTDLMPLDEVWRPAHEGERIVTWILALTTAIVVGLSAAGIYSLTSFAVSQRTREIGIRTALGADPIQLVLTIFSRALAQIAVGVLGGVLVFALVGIDSTNAALLVAGMAGLMLLIGLLACMPSAARALRVQPTEALRADG